MTLELNRIYNMDCLEGMRQIEDKSIDLVITDPPYGIGDKLAIGGCKVPNRMQELYLESQWNDIKPTKEYFGEMFRISKNQIICGGNYFDLPPTRGFIVWDKVKFASNYSQCEYIWTSFDCISRIFKFCSNGGFVIAPEDEKIHPTQKPIKLFEWIIKNYAKEGDIICDPFFGSGSCLVAAVRLGHPIIGVEKERTYFTKGKARIEAAQKQNKLHQWGVVA